jgi:hypothetical protein
MDLTTVHGTPVVAYHIYSVDPGSPSGTLAAIKDGDINTWHMLQGVGQKDVSGAMLDCKWSIVLDTNLYVESVSVYIIADALGGIPATHGNVLFEIEYENETGQIINVLSSDMALYVTKTLVNITLNKVAKRINVRVYGTAGVTTGSDPSPSVYAILYEVIIYGEEWTNSNMKVRCNNKTVKLLKRITNNGKVRVFDGNDIISLVDVATSHHASSGYRVVTQDGSRGLAEYT